jgi:hypothetical protein
VTKPVDFTTLLGAMQQALSSGEGDAPDRQGVAA